VANSEQQQGLHQPVLLKETLAALRIKPEGVYLDGTFGRGGHSCALLAQLRKQGRLFALDKDPEAFAKGKELISTDKRFTMIQGSFAELDRYCDTWGVQAFDGILLDIGVSSPQLDDARRGFSFRLDGPLDMRMDPARGVSASEWLADARETEITNVLREFGEERQARRIARKIVESRRQEPIQTTRQLAGLIKSLIGNRKDKKHPATKSFQAIRIYINNELAELATGLKSAIRHLRPDGRLVVISFHSLEDRLVKRTFREAARPGPVSRRVPMAVGRPPVLKLIGKAQSPSDSEILGNPRSRSAVLRAAEYLG
jgi:16S rRNA (cytosine1402-N4)-methyltransferase